VKNVADIYALSPMQRLMLLHAKSAGRGEDVLFNQIVYTISGSLNQEAYRRAWQLIVDRHPALRTIFVWKDAAEPVQVVRELAELPWSEQDWRTLSPGEQELELERLLRADRDEGFDLLRAPLMRLALIQIADHQHWLVWSSHHLIIDRWCIGVIFNELKTAYEAFINNISPHIVPAPRYRDYIAWIAGQSESKAREFWRQWFTGTGPRLLVSGSPNDVDTLLSRASVTVEKDTILELQHLARANDLTQGTLITAAWAVVLSAITGSDDVVFGLTVSGRPADLQGVERTVGCFINNVPFRVQFNDATPVTAWLLGLQESQLMLKPFEYASPVQIRSWSNIAGSGPLFDSLLVLQAPVEYSPPPGLDIVLSRGGMQTGYPISLGAVTGSGDLRLIMTYDRRVVSPDLAAQLVEGLRNVLQALPGAGDMVLSHLRDAARIRPSLTPAARIPTQVAKRTRSYVPPRSAAEHSLAHIWSEVLGISAIGVEDRFFEIGGDSISSLQLLSLLEQRMGKSLSIGFLLGNPSVTQMAEELGSDSIDSSTDPVLLPINPHGKQPPFFYAHGIFGDISSLTNMVPMFSPDQPVYGLQAAGLHPDLEPDSTIEQMAQRYVRSIREVQPDGPYYIGGFCFGGVLAYEIARTLEQQGEKTALLAIIEGVAPRQFHNRQSILSPKRLTEVKFSGEYWLNGYEEFGGRQVARRLKHIMGLNSGKPQRAGRNEVFDNMVEFNEFELARPESQFELREINRQAINSFTPLPYGGHVTLFLGRHMHIGRTLFHTVDPHRGWGNLAAGGVTIHYVEGSHIGLLRRPFVIDLAQKLQAAIQQARIGET
jgi:thioesterase domain-containing protein